MAKRKNDDGAESVADSDVAMESVTDTESMPGRKPGRASTKTPEELEAQYNEATDHGMMKVEQWLDNVKRRTLSKKYPRTPEQVAAVKSRMTEAFNSFLAAFDEATGEEKKFTFCPKK